jgi:hypothetical protein
MAKYKISGDGYFDTEENLFIPNDPGNRHYQLVQEWISEGNTPDPEFTAEELTNNAWSFLRGTRNTFLEQTDWMVLQDYFNTLTAQQQTDLTTYRQALRDLPANTSDPEGTINWPTRPGVVVEAIGEQVIPSQET